MLVNLKILLLEAGGSSIPDNVRNPSLWYTLLGSDVDWKYNSVPQIPLDVNEPLEITPTYGKVIESEPLVNTPAETK